jgi:hypothetical protein
MLAGCTTSRQADPVPPVPTPDPDAVALDAALALTERLRAAYAATMARHTPARPSLDLLAAEHDAHAEALQSALTAAGEQLSPTGTSSPPSTSTSPPPRVPAKVSDALIALAAREDTAARAHDAALGAVTAESARLLAAVCAARAAHAALLRAGRA